MADLNVALILRLVDRATGPARAAMRAIERIGGQSIMDQAAKVQRGSRMMTEGLGGIGRAAQTAGLAMIAWQGTVALVAGAFVRPAAQFERFNVQLTNLEGSAAGAKTAMEWIENFATRTPLEMEDTVNAYVKLKAFGIDPTNGSLMAMVDTMAATGGGAEQLDGIVLALGQAWTKQKLQGEEAMQLLERGVPVWDLLAEKTGKNAAELMKMASAGELGRAEIMMLIDALGERNAGASEAMSKTWDGIISNLMDYWSRFRRMVMDAGVFDLLKGQLQDLLAFLNEAAADGRLQDWADRTAIYMLLTFQTIRDAAIWVHEAWAAVWPVLDGVAQSIGGWDVMGWAAALLLFRGTILGAIGGLIMLSRGLLLVLSGITGAGGIAVVRALAMAVMWLGRAFLIAGRFLLANPIIAVITAIAGLAYVIYQNWDGIVAYFAEKIDRVRAAFDEGLLSGVLKLLSEFNPFKLMIDGAVALLEYLTGWDLTFVTDMLYDVFGISLFDAGMNMILSLWEGLKSKMGELKAWFAAQIASMLPDWMRTGMGTGGAAEGPQASSTTGESFDFDGQRELGGAVRAGATYKVGEHGVELFTSNRDGWIIPNRKLSGGGQGRSSSLSIGGITINAAPGMSPEMIARAVRSEIERVAREGRFALNDGGSYA